MTAQVVLGFRPGMKVRPATAVDRMLPIRGHTASGLKQDVTVRVFAAGDGAPTGWGCLDIDGHSFRFTSRNEALALLDEYLVAALARAAGARPTP
jgi:hypothetical protein